MDYDTAVTLISEHYGPQMDRIKQLLSKEAIITLGNLKKQGVERKISEFTLVKLSKMEPHQQSGYLANPLMAFLIEQCCGQICNPSAGQTQTESKVVPVDKNTKSNTNNNVPKPKPKPEPEPEPEPDPDIDDPVFDIFG